MRLLLLLCLLLLTASFRVKADITDKLLDELTQVLAKKNVHFKQRADRIATLTQEFNAPQTSDEAKLAVGLRIYQEYKSFKYDSAFL